MNIQKHIRRIIKEEIDKKQSLLKIIEENGLYAFMEMTGLSLPEVYENAGELPRNILEQYLIDCIMEEGHETHYDDRKYLLVATSIKEKHYGLKLMNMVTMIMTILKMFILHLLIIFHTRIYLI
jgi:hypothetical protein